MIKKGRLTKGMENRISEGEEGIPLLNRHLTSALFFTKLGQDRSKAVREKITLFATSPQRRQDLFQELKKNLQANF